VVALLAGVAGNSTPSRAETGQVAVVFTKGGLIVGVGGGEGVLVLRGKRYPFTVSGMSVGFTIGASTTNINILNGSRSVFTRDASFGGNQYTSLLQKELGLTFEQAEHVKRGMPLPEGVEDRDIAPILETVSDILALEIQKTMDFYRATVEDGGSAVQKILVSGGGSKSTGLIEFLSTQFEIPVEIFDPFKKIKIDSRGFDPEYMREIVPEMAIAVGLALRGVDAR